VEPEKQTAGLYDFLYRDSNRIASYYAQIFHGRLSSFEEILSDRSGSESNFKGSIHVAAAEQRANSQIEIGSKKSIDPHDLIATDVLTSLRQCGYLN
jgi:hypothetical protein